MYWAYDKLYPLINIVEAHTPLTSHVTIGVQNRHLNKFFKIGIFENDFIAVLDLRTH